MHVHTFCDRLCFCVHAMPKIQDSKIERDINDIFDDIILSEERLVEKGYKEGFAKGCQQGITDGYNLGFAQGVFLGQELAEIYGSIVALQQQSKHTEKVKRCMQQLKSLIETFPKENNNEIDIIGSLEQIRNLNKKLLLLLGAKSIASKSVADEHRDLSF